MPLLELRLPRWNHAKGDIRRMLPHGARCLRVRYTRTLIIALYR